jgi:signal transduction histidine kinase
MTHAKDAEGAKVRRCFIDQHAGHLRTAGRFSTRCELGQLALRGNNNRLPAFPMSLIDYDGSALGFPFSRRRVAAKFAGVTGWLKHLEGAPKRFVAPLCVLIVTVVAEVDFLSGYETFFFIFYLMAVILGVWFVNPGFGVLMSALSVAAWISSNIEAGARYSSYFVPVWNALIMFVFYLIVVWLLVKVRDFNRELEERVRLRTESLAKEVRDRMRLQKELIEAGERERARIGHELHDSLCQHLTGTALNGHLTGQKLAAQSLPEAAEVGRLVELIEQAIEMTRSLSRSLSPVEWLPGRLALNFQELAANSSELFNVQCRFECHESGPLPEAEVASHLYHIAEEAIVNAVRHGKAKNIVISLDATEEEWVLNVTDDGTGIPENHQNSKGMGLRIMAYRADLIGGTFSAGRQPGRGTHVTCTLPNPSNSQEKNGN